MPRAAPSVGGHSLNLRAVAAHGLAGTLHDMPPKPLDPAEYESLYAQVRRQKLTGLFWAAISDGAFSVTPAQAEAAEEMHVKYLAGNLLLEELLLDTVAALNATGIPVRALKGAAMAHLDYPDPAHRTFGDIDLLVPGEAFDDAVAVLASRGHRRKFPEPRPGFDRTFGKGVCFRAGGHLEIDLHRTFTMGPFGQTLALEELWKASDSFDLAGTTIESLTVEARLLHAAYHATLGDRRPRLAPLRDVAQVLLYRNADWQRLQELMIQSRGEAVVARAIGMAWRELHLADVLVQSAWAEAYQEDRQEAADIALYGESSSYALRSFAALRAVPGFTQKARFFLALAVPERSYVSDRHEGRLQRLGHGIAQVRRGSGR